MESTEKIKILQEKGMEINQLDFDQLEFVYDIVINNKETEIKPEKKQYEKINWDGESQLVLFLSIVNRFKVCKSIKKNNNSTILNIFSLLENEDQFYILSKPKIILKKIKKRCDFIITSDKWIKNTHSFREISENKFLWLESIEEEKSLEELKKLCSLVLNDNMELKKVVENVFF